MEENTKYVLLGVGVLLLIMVLFAFQGTGTTATQTGAFLMGDSTRYIAPEDNVQASLTGGTTTGSTIINNIFDTNGGTASSGLSFVSATDTNAGYLLGKLVAGTNISFTQQNLGGDEVLEINVDSLTAESDPYFFANVSDIVFDGNNVSRLTNDSNYQTLSNVQAMFQPLGNYLIPDSDIVYDGNDVSRLVNDANYQSYDNILDFGFLTSVGVESDPVFVAQIPNIVFDGNDVSRLVNDANYLSGQDAFAYFQVIGDYLSSIPSYVIMDTNNASRLTNDLNWQSYADVQNLVAGATFTLPAGLVYDTNSVSILNNDVNYQTFTNVSDLISSATFTLPAGLVWDSNGVSILTNDSNYQTYTNIGDFNYITGTDAYANFQIQGTYLTSFTESDPVFVANVSDIVFDGNNVSRLVNDANYLSGQNAYSYFQVIGDYLSELDANALYYNRTDFNYLTFLTTDDDSAYQLKADLNTDVNNFINTRGFLTSYTDSNVFTRCGDTNQFLLGSGVCIDYDFPATYRPTSVIESGSGSIVDSNIYLIQYYDGLGMEFVEGSGTDPLTIDINFTGVGEFDELVIREYYLGSSSHHVLVELYEPSDNSWEEYYSFVGQAGYNIISVPVNDYLQHLDGGVVQLRLRHIENGITSHRLYIDSALLTFKESSGASSNLDGFAKYSFGYNNFDGNGNFTTSGNVTATNLYGNYLHDHNLLYYKITDFNYLTFLTSINGLNISDLVNDSNYQTDEDVLSFISDFVTAGDLSTYALAVDVNSWGDARYQPLGSYLTAESDPVFVANVSDIVFDGNNVSRLVNDAGYMTKAQSDGNYQPKGAYLLADASIVYDTNGVSRLVNDAGYMTKAQSDGNYWALTTNLITVAQADANYWAKTNEFITKAQADGNYATITDSNNQFFKKTGGNVTGSVVASVDLNGSNVHADNNVTIGTNGYITISGSTMIIGMN